MSLVNIKSKMHDQQKSDSDEVLLFNESQRREQLPNRIITVETVALSFGVLDGADLIHAHLGELISRLALAPTLFGVCLSLNGDILQFGKDIFPLYLLVDFQILILQVLNSLDTLQLQFPTLVDLLISDDLTLLLQKLRIDPAQLLLPISDALAVLLHHQVQIIHFLGLVLQFGFDESGDFRNGCIVVFNLLLKGRDLGGQYLLLPMQDFF